MTRRCPRQLAATTRRSHYDSPQSLAVAWAIGVYAFLHVPMLILAVFSFNGSRYSTWTGLSLDWYRAVFHDPQLAQSAWNSLIIAITAMLISTVIGTLCAYGLWRRSSPWLSGSLYLSLVTPEIVTGVSLLAFYQWIFRYLQLHLGMQTVILAHVAFSIAYVVIVVLARLRTFDPALEEAALDLGATEWQAFLRVTLPSILPGVDRRGPARLHGLHRRLRHHQPRSGRRFRNAADGDLRHGAPRHQPGSERHLDHDRLRTGRAHPVLGKAARSMNRRLFLMGLAGAAGCSPKRARRLNVYNWSVYIAPETVPNFEREFNAEVRYLTFESAEEMLAKVAAGNSGWDIVFPSNSFIPPMREQGLARAARPLTDCPT